MPKFKKGDRIRYTSSEDRSTGDWWTLEKNEEIVVIEVTRKCYLLDAKKAASGSLVQFTVKQDLVDPHSTLLISSHPLFMSVLQKARDLFLSEDERLYRESGLKDACGNWTDEARQIFLEQL